MLLILKSRIQKPLDSITGEHQSEAIKKRIILHTLSICDIIDVSKSLNKNLSVISLAVSLSFLFCISSDMLTNSFT